MRYALLSTVAAAALSLSVAAVAQSGSGSGAGAATSGGMSGSAAGSGGGAGAGATTGGGMSASPGSSGQGAGAAASGAPTGRGGTAAGSTGEAGRTGDTARTGETGRTGDTARTGDAAKTGTDAKAGADAKARADAKADASATGSINISNDQRVRIRQSFTSINVAPVTDVSFSVGVGTVIPASVSLHDCPDPVERLLTGLPECKFVIVRDQIVIIEPRSRKIITVIERSG